MSNRPRATFATAAFDGRAAAAGIGKGEQAVLIVGGAGARVVDADLIVVVLASVFPQCAELERVIAPDLGEGIANVVDDSAGARGVRTAIERAETRKLNRRNFVGNHLGGGSKEVWVVDAVFGAVIKAGRGIDVDVDVVRSARDIGIIDHGGADGPGVVEDTNLVGPVKDARVGVEVAEVRLVIVVVVVEKTEAEVVSVVRNEIDDDAVFSLLLGIKRRVDPVAGGIVGEIGCRVRVEQANAVGAELVSSE